MTARPRTRRIVKTEALLIERHRWGFEKVGIGFLLRVGLRKSPPTCVVTGGEIDDRMRTHVVTIFR